MREIWIEISESIRRNKLRTFLTGFSVAWGILMLSILLGAGNGLRNGMLSNMGSYSVNAITIQGGWTQKGYKGYDKWRRIRLRDRDLEILRTEFPEIGRVAAIKSFPGREATCGERFKKVDLIGSLPEIASMENVEILHGRFIDPTDIRMRRKTLVINRETAVILTGSEDALGSRIDIDGSVYTVVGIYDRDQAEIDARCYIPLSTGQLIYDAGEPTIGRAVLTVARSMDKDEAEAFEKRIRRRLAAEHDFDPEDDSALWYDSMADMHRIFSMIFSGMSLFLWLIGLGTLFSGVVGVSNIMLVTVAERTNEFGIRKALGASPASVIRLILTESIAITALFGYVGILLGIAVMEVVAHYVDNMPVGEDDIPLTFFKNPTLDLSIALSATLLLIVSGVIAGYMPARRAARLKTIDALRHNK